MFLKTLYDSYNLLKILDFFIDTIEKRLVMCIAECFKREYAVLVRTLVINSSGRHIPISGRTR
ncbi:hypothetical protein CSB45_07250 [candidate division KSB3 bacterium]|uniref:Uncharacterized protein n=1 Tax=candidate division KSB3 bacterium TaxID=2044937 RepID=A0A2G6E6C3_9BACT|nr:MAG: hypothetical protein CSB45_07250 [candidate division KSB3 bacterium]